jgi:alkylhydroperoxidase family enzyme
MPHSMIAPEQKEKLRFAFHRTRSTIGTWITVSKERTSKILKPALRGAGNATTTIAELWRSLTLARRFYPTLKISSAEMRPAGTITVEDAFDPILVRSLPRRWHALIRFRVAIRIGSISRANHAALLCQSEGWTAAQLGAASAGYDWTAFTEVERLVLRYTDDLTRTPMDVDMGTLRALKNNLSADQMVELAASISQENFRARFQTGVDASRAISEPAA